MYVLRFIGIAKESMALEESGYDGILTLHLPVCLDFDEGSTVVGTWHRVPPGRCICIV